VFVPALRFCSSLQRALGLGHEVSDSAMKGAMKAMKATKDWALLDMRGPIPAFIRELYNSRARLRPILHPMPMKKKPMKAMKKVWVKKEN
jgi:hypothetical protein